MEKFVRIGYSLKKNPKAPLQAGGRRASLPHYATMQTKTRRSNRHEGASGELNAQKSWQNWRLLRRSSRSGCEPILRSVQTQFRRTRPNARHEQSYGPKIGVMQCKSHLSAIQVRGRALTMMMTLQPRPSEQHTINTINFSKNFSNMLYKRNYVSKTS